METSQLSDDLENLIQHYKMLDKDDIHDLYLLNMGKPFTKLQQYAIYFVIKGTLEGAPTPLSSLKLYKTAPELDDIGDDQQIKNTQGMKPTVPNQRDIVADDKEQNTYTKAKQTTTDNIVMKIDKLLFNLKTTEHLYQTDYNEPNKVESHDSSMDVNNLQETLTEKNIVIQKEAMPKLIHGQDQIQPPQITDQPSTSQIKKIEPKLSPGQMIVHEASINIAEKRLKEDTPTAIKETRKTKEDLQRRVSKDKLMHNAKNPPQKRTTILLQDPIFQLMTVSPSVFTKASSRFTIDDQKKTELIRKLQIFVKKVKLFLTNNLTLHEIYGDELDNFLIDNKLKLSE